MKHAHCPSCDGSDPTCYLHMVRRIPVVPGPITAILEALPRRAGWPVGWLRLCRLQTEFADSVRLGERLKAERDAARAEVERELERHAVTLRNAQAVLNQRTACRKELDAVADVINDADAYVKGKSLAEIVARLSRDLRGLADIREQCREVCAERDGLAAALREIERASEQCDCAASRTATEALDKYGGAP